MKKCIVNGKIILHDEIVEKNVFIDDDKIVEISDRQPTDEDIIDAKGMYVQDLLMCIHMVEVEATQCIRLLKI